MYERREPALYRFALHMSGSPAVAEEVSHEVFVQLMGPGTRFDETRGSLESFLYGIARNLVRVVRRQGPVAEAVDRPFEHDILGELIERRNDGGAPSNAAGTAGTLPGCDHPVRSGGAELRGRGAADRASGRDGAVAAASRPGAAVGETQAAECAVGGFFTMTCRERIVELVELRAEYHRSRIGTCERTSRCAPVAENGGRRSGG